MDITELWQLPPAREIPYGAPGQVGATTEEPYGAGRREGPDM
jgi:hypothetical protein